MKTAPVLCKDYPAELDALTKELRARTFDPNNHYIVLTPDRYTLQAEKALFGGSGALDCEVLTLSRLSRRVLGNKKTLSREGGVMLVARAISDVAGELCYYKQAAKYYDFARQVYQTLIQISSSFTDELDSISALKERASGVTRLKLADLELIEAGYKRYKADCLDASDRLTELIKAAATSELIARSEFYIVGYRDATRLNMRVFDAIEKHCAGFKYFDAEIQREKQHPAMTVYRAPDAVTGYKAVAMRIVNAVKSGKYSFGDISVICTEPRTLSRIFREYGIDFYADETATLDRTPPVMLLADCYKLYGGGGNADDVIALCKNPFSGCAADDAEQLQNYFDEHGIEYGALSLKLDGGAERAQGRAKDILNAFSSCKVFDKACRAVMEFCAFEETAGSDTYKNETDMLAPLYSALGEVEKCGSGIFEVDAKGFFSMAKEIKVRSRPRYADQVTVCLPPTLRLTRSKLLFITDFNEGVLPTVTQDGGLLSDVELNALDNAVEPTARERNRRDRAELTAVIDNAERVFCTYSANGNNRRAAYLSMFRDKKYDVTYESDVDSLASGDARKTLEFCCTVGSAREISARKMTPYAGAIRDAVGAGDHAAAEFIPDIGTVKRASLSVTELNHWFDCPYKRFLSDSIEISERKRGRNAADFGTVMHDFMRRFVADGTYDVSAGAIEKLVRETLDADERMTDDEKRALLSDRRFMSDAAAFAAVNKHIIEAGSYIPACEEEKFGNGIMLGADKSISLNGAIDRVDYCGDRARIIDYKTGNKKFDEKKCRSGRDMQLPLYAAVMEEKGKTVTGMYYSTVGAPYDGKVRKLRGCTVKDVGVVREYDGKLDAGEASDVITAKFKKDGDFDGRFDGGLYTWEQFRALIDGSLANADCAADEITGGYIERTPADGACDYCPYVGLCYDKKFRTDGDDGFTDDDGYGDDE